MSHLITSHELSDGPSKIKITAYDSARGGAPSVFLLENPDNKTQEVVLQFMTATNAWGLTNEALLAVIEHRLKCWQEGEFPCIHNQAALEHIGIALDALKHRTAERRARGVEGQYVA